MDPCLDTIRDDSKEYCHTQAGQWVGLVRPIVGRMQYGEVQLIVKDSSILEVRKIEKIRLAEATRSRRPEMDESLHYCETHIGKWVRLVKRLIENLQFGEVHLTVQDGRVVEVRKLEKHRL